MKDMFVYNNYVSAGYDDALEAEGEDINAAYWGNTLVNPWPPGGSFCRMAIGLAPVAVGPLYIFRNTLLNFGDATLKLGNSTGGRIYYYHNVIYGRGPATYGNNNLLANMVMRNNIGKAIGMAIFNWVMVLMTLLLKIMLSPELVVLGVLPVYW